MALPAWAGVGVISGVAGEREEARGRPPGSPHIEGLSNEEEATRGTEKNRPGWWPDAQTPHSPARRASALTGLPRSSFGSWPRDPSCLPGAPVTVYGVAPFHDLPRLRPLFLPVFTRFPPSETPQGRGRTVTGPSMLEWLSKLWVKGPLGEKETPEPQWEPSTFG